MLWRRTLRRPKRRGDFLSSGADQFSGEPQWQDRVRETRRSAIEETSRRAAHGGRKTRESGSKHVEGTVDLSCFRRSPSGTCCCDSREDRVFDANSSSKVQLDVSEWERDISHAVSVREHRRVFRGFGTVIFARLM